MSHIVTIKTQIKDAAALAAACLRLGLSPPKCGTARLFATQATGLIVQLPGWSYPLVIDASCGELFMDNYGGQWGEQKQLDRLLQAYACEAARIEARRAGHSVTEQVLADGSIKLVIGLSGGGA